MVYFRSIGAIKAIHSDKLAISKSFRKITLMNLIYETERTKVRLFSENDIADAYELMSDPIVAKDEYWSSYNYDDTK